MLALTAVKFKSYEFSVDVQTGNEETQIDESLTLFSPNVEENVTMYTISTTAGKSDVI